MNVLPGSSFEAVTIFQTGLTGTVGVRIRDNEGNDALARQTSGIAEDISGSGIYRVTLTAPATAGQYSLVWDDGDTPTPTYAVESLLVVQDALSSTVPSGHDYISLADLKSTSDLNDINYADADLQRAITAASRGIDQVCNRRFYTNGTETRYYTPISPQQVIIDDVVSVSELMTDQNFDGVFEEEWTENSDFILTPMNNGAKDEPYTRLELMISWNVVKVFPAWSNRSVKLTGIYGWSPTPAPIIDATTIIATKLAKRKREAPFGIVTSTLDVGVAARIGRTDPDVNFLLMPFMRELPS